VIKAASTEGDVTVPVPDNLAEQVKNRLTGSDLSWSTVVARIAEERT
jgi:hypothetical protein